MQVNRKRAAALALTLILSFSSAAAQSRKEIKPGFNLFSKEQDVELGKEASQQIEQEVQIVNDKRLTAYVEGIGKKLAEKSQDPSYPFTFKVVADPAINAFALPGGPIYIHSGLIAAADNEAQLAGVLSHEIGHVVLRHSTNQASKAAGFQLLAAMAGGALGGGESMLGSLAQMGLGFGLNSAMLKYSRSAESDSDIVGARNLAAAGYNPVEMATFFQKLDDSGGARGAQFFSSHPNPGNRVKAVTEEIQDYRSDRYITDTKDFPSMKARAAKIQPVKQPDKPGQGAAQTAQPGSTASEAPKTPAAPAATRSDGTYRAQNYILKPPMGWKVFPADESDGVTIIPDNGTLKLADGSIAVARGLMAGVFPSSKNQADATSDLIRNLQGDNPKLQVMAGQRRSMRFGGAPGESVFLQSESPIAGEREYVWMATAKRSKGLFYLLMISPAGEYNSLRRGFEEVVKSVKFK